MSEPADTAVEVFRFAQRDETWFAAEGVHIHESLNDPRHPELSIARARLGPGQGTRVHRVLETVERYLVVEGRGRFASGEQTHEVGPGDVVLIGPGAPQRIDNIGAGDLVFYALCTPRFVPENYR